MKLTKITVTAMFFCLTAALIAADQPVSAEMYREAVSRLIDIQKETSSEKQSWKKKKKNMLREEVLLQKELTSLQSLIQDADKRQKSSAEKTETLKEKKSRLVAGIERIMEAVRAAEEKLLAWRKRLPAPFSEKTSSLFDRIKNPPDPSVGRRLQIVLELYAEIGKLQNSIHLEQQVIQDSDGTEREFAVIYLGLTAAYAVSGDNKEAGYAFPGRDNAWKWHWDSGLASRVRAAVEIYRKVRISEYVDLPLHINEKDKK